MRRTKKLQKNCINTYNGQDLKKKKEKKKRENIRQLWGFNRGDRNISASAVPNNKDTFKTKRNGKLQHIELFKQYSNIWKWSFLS